MLRQRWLQSLQFRLLVATLVGLLLALLMAGVLLAGLFREHVMRQFVATLTTQLDQVTARLDFDATGMPVLDAQALSDPRWSRPLSGLYWQIESQVPSADGRLLRSRSLWDDRLTAPKNVAALAVSPGAVQVDEAAGPGGARLLLVQRSVAREGASQARWRVMVAGDLHDTALAVNRFNSVLASSLAVLMILLGLAAAAQLVVGLAPLRALQRALADVVHGRAQRLAGRFPAEVQPLAENFNAVLDRNAAVVARARTQAGNLAHAIKTPLAVMAQAAASAQSRPSSSQDAELLATLVMEQTAVANRQVDWHLTRARVAASQALPGARVPVGPVIDGLVRVMERVHAAKGLQIVVTRGPAEPAVGAALAFAGEVQDLQEMLGNLLDNACKWARHEVHIQACSVPAASARRLLVSISDDGPGIDADQRQAVLARGARLDETVPGSGLGLAIVHELAGLYGGELKLAASATGGLQVELDLPLAP